MNSERLLALFDQVADAPDAVPRLRRFVLDLAVRGKLVEQGPADEPASELLKLIAVEKERLVGAGEIRKPRNLSDGEDIVPPFDLPVSWKWCRLDNVGAIIGGGTPLAADPANFCSPGEGIPWLTPADLSGHNNLFIEHGKRDLTEKGLQSSSATIMSAGSVLFTSRAPIGYVAIAANAVATNQGFKSIVPYVADCSRFIAVAMQAFALQINANASGTTFKEVSGKFVSGLPFPLPPLTEQRRIVTKVDELMALCDQLDEACTAREDTRERLTKASYAPLSESNADDAVTFRSHARFVVDALPALTARADQVKRLRQMIRNLAVRGKLVGQDSFDEPASALLKRIAMERDQVVDKRILRRQKSLAAITTDEPPFEVPSGWEWSRIGNAVLFTQYGTSIRAFASKSGVPVLTMGNIRDGHVICQNEKRISDAADELSALFLKRFDLLYNRTNSAELVGKTGIYLGEDDRRTFASYLIRIRASLKYSSPHFINVAMNTTEFRKTQIVPIIKKQTGQANVNGTALKNMLIPIPPLPEQHRIVAKVDELMILCDQLKSGLVTANTTGRRLHKANLEELLTLIE